MGKRIKIFNKISFVIFINTLSCQPSDKDMDDDAPRAFDAVSGNLKWIFHTIPQNGKFWIGYLDWVEGEQYGSANPGEVFLVNSERGWVFFATGSPANDYFSRPRIIKKL